MGMFRDANTVLLLEADSTASSQTEILRQSLTNAAAQLGWKAQLNAPRPKQRLHLWVPLQALGHSAHAILDLTGARHVALELQR